MSELLTIKNLDKIVKQKIGDDFIVANMVSDRSIYRIFLNDMEGVHKRDLRLHRYPSRLRVGEYKLEYGSTYKLLPKSDISNIDTFCSAIETLVG
jgi:hypothetical protein